MTIPRGYICTKCNAWVPTGSEHDCSGAPPPPPARQIPHDVLVGRSTAAVTPYLHAEALKMEGLLVQHLGRILADFMEEIGGAAGGATVESYEIALSRKHAELDEERRQHVQTKQAYAGLRDRARAYEQAQYLYDQAMGATSRATDAEKLTLGNRSNSARRDLLEALR